MNGKLNPDEWTRAGTVFALDGYGILALEGPDALDFAQSQLMNDVRRLAIGDWQWSGWLNAKGRLIALMRVVRNGPESLWLILPDHSADALAEALDRYRFRSKVQLRVVTDWHVGATIVRSDNRLMRSNAPREYVSRDDKIRMPSHFECGALSFPDDDESAAGSGWFRRLMLQSTDDEGLATADANWLNHWQLSDVRLGLPHLDADLREQFTPQMLALNRLRAFSVKKGCYPGQEVVSRTHFLGQTKRRLQRIRLRTNAPIQDGDAVTSGGQAIARLFNSVRCGNVAEALAILPDSPEDLMVAEAPATVASLLDASQLLPTE